MSYQALYAFRSDESGTLCFEEGAKFTLLDSADTHWWQVTDAYGQVGFVPANYIEKLKGNKQADVISSIDRAIEFIHLSATQKGGPFTHEQRKTLQKLIEHRQAVLSANPKSEADGSSSGSARSLSRSTSQGSKKHRAAPPPPMRSLSTEAKPTPPSCPQTSPPQAAPATAAPSTTAPSTATASPETERGKARTAVAPIEAAPAGANKGGVSPSSSPSSPSPSPSSPPWRVRSPSVPGGLGEELVELVRVRTGLSYAKSGEALAAVFVRVREAVPAVAGPLDKILVSLQQALSTTSNNSRDGVGGGGNPPLEGSRDAQRLQVIFAELTDCKNDSQQRSWALHEDEAVISEYLEELASILSDAHPDVCKAVIQRDDYEAINSLVLYYQMEHRTSLRLLLLKVFGVLCGLDSLILSQLLCTVLPTEIVRDMQADVHCLQKLCFSSLVATMLLSTGQPLPYSHYDQLNEEFVSFLLNGVECPPPEDESDQIPDLFINLILAFNLLFTDPSENLVMKVLAQRQTSRTFSEKMMILVNREDDPVRMFEYEPKPPNSLLKMLSDIFASADTSLLFYTNDLNVLIDIIIRQLTDRCPGDKQRTEYLSLIHRLLQMPVYSEHKHRLADIRKILTKIAGEEDAESKADKDVLMKIRKDCRINFTIKF